jgi:hypothetical protein
MHKFVQVARHRLQLVLERPSLVRRQIVENDIVAPFRPLTQFRKRLTSDLGALARAAYLWINTTESIIDPIRHYFECWGDSRPAPPCCIVPAGYHELTHMLIFWCDVSSHNIDARSLGDLLARLRDMSEENWHRNYPNAYREYCRVEKRARRAVDRMLYVAMASASQVPPLVDRSSRNPDRDDWIVEQDAAGKTLRDIRTSIPKQNAAWVTLGSDRAVFSVLKRRGKR